MEYYFQYEIVLGEAGPVWVFGFAGWMGLNVRAVGCMTWLFLSKLMDGNSSNV